MIRSEIVEKEYRLQVEDLPEGRLQATVANVSFQGLEQMQPVLHFDGYTKALVLTKRQCIQIVELTGSVVAEDWIGRTLQLYTSPQDDGAQISIATGKRHQPRRWMHKLDWLVRVPMWLRVSLFVAIIGIGSLVYTIQNWDALSAVWSQLFP